MACRQTRDNAPPVAASPSASSTHDTSYDRIQHDDETPANDHVSQDEVCLPCATMHFVVVETCKI
jgi:hypothetical protein